MKTKLIIILAALFALTLSACGSGTNPVTVSTSGQAVKGPFVSGSTVTAYKLNNDGTRTATTETTATTDDLGSYVLDIPFTGLTEIEITGNYLDENTGTVTATPGTVSAIIVIPATGTVTEIQANPNPLSTMSASLTKAALTANPIPASADAATLQATVETVKQSSDIATAQAFGIPTKTASGKDIDLTTINILDTANTETGEINKAALIASATIQQVATSGAGVDVAQLMNDLAADIKDGKALGSTGGNTATIIAEQTAVTANVATIAANITAVINTANNADIQADTTLDTALATTATTVVANTATTLRGLAMQNNTFTFGAATFAIDATGVATSATSTPSTNTVFGFTLVDNTASTVAGTAKTYSTVFFLDIAAAAATDQRQISATVPVTITTDGAGAVSATVDASAVFTYNGVDSAGVTVSGTATNVAANVIQASANVIAVDFNSLLTTIKNNLGTNSNVFDVLNITGSYTFNFAITGVEIGVADAANTGIAQLFPLTSHGRGVSGTLVIQ